MFWSKPKEPQPHPQEPEDRGRFQLQNTFSVPASVFLANVTTYLYKSSWAGFSAGADLGLGGGEEEGLGLCTYAVLQGSWSKGRGFSLRRAMFPPEWATSDISTAL